MQHDALNVKEIDAKKLAKAMAGECIAFRVRLLNRVITNLYNHALQPLGIKANQSIILVLLISSDKCSQGEVGRILHMEKSTVSRNIERMRAKGWIEMKKDDGESHLLVVTTEGRRLLIKIYSKWLEAQQRARSLLGETGVDRIAQLIEKLH